MNPRRSIPLIGLAVLLVGWVLAYTGFRIARNTRVTAVKVTEFVASTNLADLEGEARARAIDRLAKKINALPIEERRQARIDRAWAGWFQNMNEQERTAFVEATLPTGFRQMISAFEELPPEQRKNALETAIRRVREGRGISGERPPDISPEIEEKAISIGIETLFTQSSAQTKAELAPLLEELQQTMESGRLLRNRRR